MGHGFGSGCHRCAGMHEMLRQQGIIPGSDRYEGGPPRWRTELGHHMNLSHTDAYGWNLSAHHMGDPVGAGLSVMLGHDDETAAARAAAEMRHPETLGHLRDQYLRAQLNNDPTGDDHRARRVPVSSGGWNVLDHYRD